MSARILIVDDSSLARRTLRQILEQQGHIVDEAADGAAALERYYINRPDVVFLDMVMEGMYGLEVLTKVRELNPDAKIIVATADIQKSTREQAQSAGASAMINKPLNRDEVVRIVSAVLQGEMVWN
ncbi:MAG TPA: response regulator [Verrucomicrobiae bacterium]|nr:response regulator [Verrucomicrobiae bacterium]